MKKLTIFACLISTAALAELQPEATGTIETLPETYPPHWIVVLDGAFFHMSDGKVIVIDADSDDAATRFKGMFNAGYIADFVQARTKPEMYVAETFRSRGNRGERTDVLTIYDKRTLAPTGEVVIPPKRASNMPTEYNLQLVDNETLALVFNFTPVQSVSVVDVVKREFLGEIPTPGCALVYPMGGRGFASLCGDGSMLSVQLDEGGQQASARRSQPFFDVDADAVMEKAAMHAGVAYFPTFLGNLHPIDLNGSVPDIGEPWSLVGDEEDGWRPGGLKLADTDGDGRLYVLMHPEGYEGSHKDPGIEVWIFDTDARERVGRIELALPAISIGVTRDDDPLLVATNINLEVDVYNIGSGEHLRTLNNFGAETAFILQGAR